MKIIIIADDDTGIGSLDHRDVDLLISCGDLHDNAILRAMEYYKPRQTLAVRGNHDGEVGFPKGVTDLHLTTFKFGGLKFGGFEGSWKYKPRGHHLFEQAEVSKLMQYFPPVDVFVAHNSPAGFHERDSDTHQGFHGFTEYLNRAKPQVFIHGHQHLEVTTICGSTTILSVFGEKMLHLDFPVPA